MELGIKETRRKSFFDQCPRKKIHCVFNDHCCSNFLIKFLQFRKHFPSFLKLNNIQVNFIHGYVHLYGKTGKI